METKRRTNPPPWPKAKLGHRTFKDLPPSTLESIDDFFFHFLLTWRSVVGFWACCTRKSSVSIKKKIVVDSRIEERNTAKCLDLWNTISRRGDTTERTCHVPSVFRRCFVCSTVTVSSEFHIHIAFVTTGFQNVWIDFSRLTKKTILCMIICKLTSRSNNAVAWPSGLRRWFKAPVSSGAWVRIPPLPTFFLHTNTLRPFQNDWLGTKLTSKNAHWQQGTFFNLPCS